MYFLAPARKYFDKWNHAGWIAVSPRHDGCGHFIIGLLLNGGALQAFLETLLLTRELVLPETKLRPLFRCL